MAEQLNAYAVLLATINKVYNEYKHASGHHKRDLKKHYDRLLAEKRNYEHLRGWIVEKI